MDREILQLVNDDRVHWSKRENGSQAYQIHRTRIHELVRMGYILEYMDGCCTRIYDLTQAGRDVLNGKAEIR